MRGLRAAEQAPARVRETFGIALVEKMLAGGGPVITTETGGIGEAVGDTALVVPCSSPAAIAAALDHALTMPEADRALVERAKPRPSIRSDRGVRETARQNARFARAEPDAGWWMTGQRSWSRSLTNR